MQRQRRAKLVGGALIALGCVLCSLLILAAFTPVGLVSVPLGAGLIGLGVRTMNRATTRRA